MLIVTASMGRLNLEATRVTLRDTVTASVGRVAFENPQRKEGGWLPGCHHEGTSQKGFGGRPPIEDVTDLSQGRKDDNCL